MSHRWHVFAVDARGHGKSDHVPGGNYNMTVQTDDAAHFIENLVGGPAVVIGHSMGALTTIGLAGTRPDLVTAAVLEDPPAFIASALQTSDFYTRFVASRDRMRSGISMEDLVAELKGNDPSGFATAIRAMAATYVAMDPEAWTPPIGSRYLEDLDMAPTLSAIECPVLLL